MISIKNRTDAREFAQLFNLQSWPDMPDDPYHLKKVDVIAVMLILNSKIEDPRFMLQGASEQNSYWQARIVGAFWKGNNRSGLICFKSHFPSARS